MSQAWIKKGTHRCRDCKNKLTQIEEAYIENLHASDYYCINCLAKRYILYPRRNQ